MTIHRATWKMAGIMYKHYKANGRKSILRALWNARKSADAISRITEALIASTITGSGRT